ncbi:MAG: hypothetical protein SFT90_00070, partial [Rickettsiales bacterium]|nr:hypothetical protein [Rickettsiales bacterium]
MTNFKEQILKINPSLKVISAEENSIEKYINIERGESAKPLFATIPSNKDELQSAIKILNQLKISAVIFAGNTGLVSSQRALNEAVLDMNNFDRLISINLQNCETLNFSALNDIKLPIKKAEIWRGELENFI